MYTHKDIPDLKEGLYMIIAYHDGILYGGEKWALGMKDDGLWLWSDAMEKYNYFKFEGIKKLAVVDMTLEEK